MNWTNSPQYMKGIQKLAAMSPEDKRINQFLIEELHGIYADVDIRKQLGAMRQATMGKRMDRSVSMASERMGMAEDVLDFEKGQHKTAEMLGWGNIGLSGLRGYADLLNKKKLTKELGGLTAWIAKQ